MRQETVDVDALTLFKGIRGRHGKERLSGKPAHIWNAGSARIPYDGRVHRSAGTIKVYAAVNCRGFRGFERAKLHDYG